jgi:hypothetical protein
MSESDLKETFLNLVAWIIFGAFCAAFGAFVLFAAWKFPIAALAVAAFIGFVWAVNRLDRP